MLLENRSKAFHGSVCDQVRFEDLNYVKKLYALACIVFARTGICVGERQVAPQLCPTLQISRTASVKKKGLAALPGASFSAVQRR